jgi:hypothetical protein
MTLLKAHITINVFIFTSPAQITSMPLIALCVFQTTSRHTVPHLPIYTQKYLYKKGGPLVTSEDADLYFDWRRLREKPKQNHENVHPGTQMFE